MPSKQPSNPPQPDITRTIREILFKDGIWPLYPESSDEAVHKLVTLVNGEVEKVKPVEHRYCGVCYRPCIEHGGWKCPEHGYQSVLITEKEASKLRKELSQ